MCVLDAKVDTLCIISKRLASCMLK